MHGGPGHRGLAGEAGLWLPLAAGPPRPTARGRSATSSITEDGLTGSNGIGYDYVLGANGLYVQSESAHLTARVLVAPCEVRGLAPVAEKLELVHGPIPGKAFPAGAGLVPGRPGHRVVLCRAGGKRHSYRLVVPPQEGTATSPRSTTPPAGVVAEFHSHGTSRAFFSKPPTTGTSKGFANIRRRWDASTPYRPELTPPGRRLRPLRTGAVVAGL